MTQTDEDRWRKSSRSANQAECVRVRGDLGALGDTKDTMQVLVADDVPAFLQAVKAGKFDLRR